MALASQKFIIIIRENSTCRITDERQNHDRLFDRPIPEAAGEPVAMTGTVEYRLGAERRKAERTTPEATDMQRMLRQAVEAVGRTAVMECSSRRWIFIAVTRSITRWLFSVPLPRPSRLSQDDGELLVRQTAIV